MRNLRPRKALHVSAAIARLLSVLSMALVALANAHGFIEVSPLTQARSGQSATLLPEGDVIVAGGIAGGQILASSEIYEPFSDSWRPAASLNVARYGHTSTWLQDGRLLVTGGWGGGTMTATAELYDWTLDTWTPASPMSVERVNHTATLLSSGNVLVCGGQNTEDFTLASCETYDPLADTWLPAATMAMPRSSHTATALPSGNILFAGGYNGSFLTSAEIYDPATDTFAPAASMAVPRYSHTATLLLSGQLLVVGGTNAAGEIAAAEVYDPFADMWTSAPSLPTPRTLHAATALLSGEVLITGGGYGDTAVSDSEIFDYASGTWRSAGSLFEGRFSPTATLLYDGNVLVVGGRTVTTDLASVEKYLPAGAYTFSVIDAEPEPSLVGQPYLVTVTVTGAGVPTGTIEVDDGLGESCGPATLVDGAGACELVASSDGWRQLTAVYTPDDATFEPSMATASHNVVEADTHLAIVSHNPDPSLPFQEVTVTVDFGVTPPGAGSPHGGIYVDDGLDHCFIPEGETNCVLTPRTRGPLTLTAVYGGDGDFNPSTAQATHHVNREPIANADSYAAFEDVPLIVGAAEGVLSNDTDDDGDTLVVVNPGVFEANGIGGTVELAADGSFTYTPPPDANGLAEFNYIVSDGLEICLSSVSIDVAAVNDAPQFVLGASPSLPAGTSGAQSIAGFATVVALGPPDESDQSVLAWHTRTIDDPQAVLTVVPSIALDGTLQFSVSGHGGVATIGVKLQDDGGTANGGQDTSAEQTFTITVAPGADLSVAIDDGTTFAEGGDPLLYMITVRNAGPDDANGAHVLETLSPNLVDATWTCTPSADATCSPSGNGGIDDHVDLPSGATLVYELSATVLADPEQPVENFVSVAAPFDVVDFNPANDSAADVDAAGIFGDGFDGSGALEEAAEEIKATRKR